MTTLIATYKKQGGAKKYAAELEKLPGVTSAEEELKRFPDGLKWIVRFTRPDGTVHTALERKAYPLLKR